MAPEYPDNDYSGSSHNVQWNEIAEESNLWRYNFTAIDLAALGVVYQFCLHNASSSAQTEGSHGIDTYLAIMGFDEELRAKLQDAYTLSEIETDVEVKDGNIAYGFSGIHVHESSDLKSSFLRNGTHLRIFNEVCERIITEFVDRTNVEYLQLFNAIVADITELMFGSEVQPKIRIPCAKQLRFFNNLQQWLHEQGRDPLAGKPDVFGIIEDINDDADAE